MKRLLPTIHWGAASATMLTNDDDARGWYLGVEWLGAVLIIEMVRR